jgi:pimeloyl-ACP methyl ester carboxylesterase
VVVAAVVAWFVRDRDAVGHWRSEAGRRAYATTYAQAMTLLPRPTRSFDVPTPYGTVRVHAFGAPTTPTPAGQASAGQAPAGQAPVVLLAGRTSGTPMWFANLADLATHRTVFAIDTLGDAGLSVQTRPLRDAEDQASWLDRTINAIGSPTVHLVGHSFGGSLATAYALRHPERIATLTLLEPVLVLQGLRWQVYWYGAVASLPMVPQRWRTRALAGLGGSDDVDLDDPVARMIADGAAQYAAALPTPRRPSTRELAGLTMPVYVAVAEHSPIHDGRAAADVARTTLPDARVVLWPGTTHSLPMEVPTALDAELLAFMSAHEPPASA